MKYNYNIAFVFISIFMSIQNYTWAYSSYGYHNVQSVKQETYTEALTTLSKIFNLEIDQELLKKINEYSLLPSLENINQNIIQELIDEKRIYYWSTPFKEYIELLDIIFLDYSKQKQELLNEKFLYNKNIIEDFILNLNEYVHAIYPAFKFLNMTNLQKNFQGKGVKIAVFDVFETNILSKQRELYPLAKINEPIIFGNPVEMSHGNHVIDVILQIAPAAEIIPVTSDTKNYADAIQMLADHSEINIVNMSRTFMQSDSDKNRLNEKFRIAFKKLIKNKIVSKSLGNTGTDFDKNLNAHRTRLGLGPVNNLFAYDLELIKDLFNEYLSEDLLIFAENLTPFARDMSLTATVPGGNHEIARRTLSLPAEGIWGQSTQNFESGSSFAAPQISAIAALLIESILQNKPSTEKNKLQEKVVESLLKTTQTLGHSMNDWGVGLLNADNALNKLASDY